MQVANERPEVNPIPVHLEALEGKRQFHVSVVSIAGFPAAIMTDFSWDLMPAWILNSQVIINSAVAKALKLTSRLGLCWPVC